MLDNVEILLWVILLWIGIFLYLRIYDNFQLTPGLKQMFDFLEKYKPDILLVVLLIFIILMYIKDKNIDLGETRKMTKEKEIKGTLVIETMGNIEQREKECNELTKKNCMLMDDCIMTKNKCVAGDQHGPKYVQKDLDKYYYKNKCYGNCN